MKLVRTAIQMALSLIKIVVISIFSKSKVIIPFGVIISVDSSFTFLKKKRLPSLTIGSRSRIIEATKIRVSNGSLALGHHCELKSTNIQANGGKINIGDNVFFNSGCIVVSTDSIEIGDNCAFGTNVSLYDHDHIYVPEGRQDWNKSKSSPIKIGKNCWIGCNVVILRGSEIGDNCVIAAGTVVKGKIGKGKIIYNDHTIITKDIR